MKRSKLHWIKENSTNQIKVTLDNYMFFTRTKIKEHKRIENKEI